MFVNVLEPIKVLQVELESSDVPKFHMCARKLIKVIYDESALETDLGNRRATKTLRDQFLKGFRKTLAGYIDNPAMLLEFGVAAFLDVRQRSLRRF